MKYLAKILIWPMLLVLAACSHGIDDPVNGTGSGVVALSFNMTTQGTTLLSRADDSNHPETASEYAALEDAINYDDLALLVFARRDSGDEKLLFKITDFTPSTALGTQRVNILGSPGNYLINLTILREEFTDFLGGYELSPEGKSTITFRMLMVANCFGEDDDRDAAWDAVTGQDFPEVMSQISTWSYSMDNLYDAAAGTSAAELYGDKAQGLPMFGTTTFSTSESMLYYSRPENRVYLGQIDMLRSVAKIRVVDNIRLKTEGYPRLKAVRFTGSRSEGMVLPFDALNYQNGNQVHSLNMYHPDDELTMADAAVYSLGTIPEQWSMTPAADCTGDTFIGFVPEQRISYADNNVAAGMPVFDIDVAFYDTDSNIEIIRTFSVPMTGYNGVQFTNFGQSILRNHIYTLRVNDVGLTMDFTVDLVPYIGCVLDPYFGIDRSDELPGIVPGS